MAFIRHDKALEAITVCGELENRGRFSKIVDALNDDHTTLKVMIHVLSKLTVLIVSWQECRSRGPVFDLLLEDCYTGCVSLIAGLQYYCVISSQVNSSQFLFDLHRIFCTFISHEFTILLNKKKNRRKRTSKFNNMLLQCRVWETQIVNLRNSQTSLFIYRCISGF